MSPRTYGYIFSALVLACISPASAQQDTVAVDSTSNKFIPTGVRVGYDLMTLGKTYFTNDFKGWEVAADIDFYRYYVVAEYGSWSVSDLIDNGLYTNDGTYFRVGVDINFLFKDPEKNMFFIGTRFARSSFSDEVNYSYDTREFPPSVFSVSNKHVVGTWLELTSDLKVKIWKFLWLGATGRFKFGLDLDGNGELRSFDVPGYGRNFKTTWWGFNYYALVRIPFRPDK